MKTFFPTHLIVFLLTCFALLSKMQAVSPPPDGGYAGGNTAEGQNALLSLTTGTYNTAIGLYSLLIDSTGNLIRASERGLSFSIPQMKIRLSAPGPF